MFPLAEPIPKVTTERTERLMNLTVSELKRRFHSRYGGSARVYRAPGRVNLIGEHTDYNGGFVMPVAIDLSTWVAIAPRHDRRLAIYSDNLSDGVEFDLDERELRPRRHWSDYVRGVAVMLERAGHRLPGANLLVWSELPIGSGLSSSAAIEVATGYGLLDTAGYQIEKIELAKLCQRAESEFVGMRCGIMDQFISCCGRKSQALMLDCRSLDYRLLRIPEGIRLVICNTMVKHELANGEYNRRRADCEAGARHFAERSPGVLSLRDVTLEDLEKNKGQLTDIVYRRCRHVISENARVTAAAEALESGDLGRFGVLMGESHLSLRNDYEVSCDELDLMVELSGHVEGVFGSRLTGGGFGGCTINLVRSENVEEFKRGVAGEYERSTGHAPEIYVCATANGVGIPLTGSNT
jgi:galactokinase